MDFEHIVTLNDPRQPGLLQFERDKVWQGLCVAVTRPELFRQGIDAVEIETLGAGRLRRHLRFGAVQVVEQIAVDHAAQRIEQHAEAPQEFAGASRMLSLESPQAGLLFVRFRYRSPHLSPARGLSADELETFKTAYLQADLDQIGLLREWMAQQAD